ncbi:MAG: hypothetical protein WBD36_11240, partial [Bacteroidota bacterium]
TLQYRIRFLMGYPEIVIDISSMSKLLIMNLLIGLSTLNKRLTIAYTEAKTYLPTRAQYQRKKGNSRLGASKLYFQTLEHSATVTSTNLSSIAMSDAPRFLVGFPTFNEDLLITLFQEFSPNACLIVHGVPLRVKDEWRLKAIKYINSHILNQISENDQIKISTYWYADTFALLERYYQQVKLTHKFIIGPPSSKLQAVAVSLFKIYRGDVQILYPTPKSYSLQEHSEQSSRVHSIEFSPFSDFMKKLVQRRHEIDVAGLERPQVLRQFNP